jgi:addiction module HigA family antidote
MPREIPYPKPGEILLEEFLKPMGINQNRLADEIDVSPSIIAAIIAGKSAITADIGLRLSRFFGMSEGFWVGLQVDYDMEELKDTLAETLAKIRPYQTAA